VRIKVTTSGSIGSGSVPVIPSGVGEGEMVDDEKEVDDGPVPDANAG
jgi:hypothetical protein